MFTPLSRPLSLLLRFNSRQMSAKPTLTSIIYGAPNAGKSSLLRSLLQLSSNSHVGVSAISPKTHTTRELIDVSVNFENFYLDVVDTPGLVYSDDSKGIKASKKLTSVSDTTTPIETRLMSLTHRHQTKKSVSSSMGIDAVDGAKASKIPSSLVTIHIIDSDRILRSPTFIEKGMLPKWCYDTMKYIAKSHQKHDSDEIIYVFSKIDKVKNKKELLPITAETLIVHRELEEIENRNKKDPMCFYVNAKTGKYVDQLKDYLEIKCEFAGEMLGDDFDDEDEEDVMVEEEEYDHNDDDEEEEYLLEEEDDDDDDYINDDDDEEEFTDYYTQEDMKIQVTEVIKEYAYKRLHKEIPYQLSYEVDLLQKPYKRVNVMVYTNRKSQVGIVIGALNAVRSPIAFQIKKLPGGYQLGDIQCRMRRGGG
ncbi:hypothetical protein TL16_g10555 [Triparma laevis f. inornata]|uniref:G domain-containing protein n=2 Tax=Triparma laevis TaxID=1534972 RepID=A0A9W7A6X6_9STRA|nr:hypothetical protein TrLO_g12775 [Triparma laevis f. longispina]GMH86467.1 hypothetical protein TL16_g10555 [Triparma laevis f. inornata]